MASDQAAITASIVAASIAADELTPLPSGTSESIRMRGALFEADAMLARQHMEHTRDVGCPVPIRIGREPRAHVLVRSVAVGDDIQRHVTPPLLTLRPGRDDGEMGGTPAAQRDAGGLANRPLQYQRSRVVGDPAHDVQPSGRARDEDGSMSAIRRLRPGPGLDAGLDRRRESRDVRQDVAGSGTGPEARRSSEQASSLERVLEMGCDDRSELFIGEADPAHVGRNVERRGQSDGHVRR